MAMKLHLFCNVIRTTNQYFKIGLLKQIHTPLKLFGFLVVKENILKGHQAMPYKFETRNYVPFDLVF